MDPPDLARDVQGPHHVPQSHGAEVEASAAVGHEHQPLAEARKFGRLTVASAENALQKL
jgi:hypothetical protein